MILSSEYGSYYAKYVANVAGDDIAAALMNGLVSVPAFFEEIPTEKQEYRYAEGKWTPKEVLLHLIDCERVFMYRAMQIARSTNVHLEGFDQDEFVTNSNANARDMDSLLKEFIAVRTATIHFIQGCNDTMLLKQGRASDSPLSVRAAA
ncbi:MAG: putative damage-inducible protein DinB, partial [Patiriisocius sp.]